MFIRATTQGEVISGALSSYFASTGSEVRSQEKLRAAPVMTARCRTGTGAAVMVRAGMEPHRSLSKRSHNQKVSPNLSAGGFHLSMNVI